MINIKNINIQVDGKTYSADVQIPSAVMTVNKQDESIDLTKTPNCFFYVQNADDIKVGINVEVVIETNEGTWSMVCDVISRNQKYTTLQYSYGLSSEGDDSSDDSSGIIEEDFSEVISQILGTEYTVINDMTEEEATEQINEIIYSEVQSFTFSQESYRCAKIGDTFIDAPVTFILDGVEMSVSPENVKIRYSWYDNWNGTSNGADYFEYVELDDNVYGFRFKVPTYPQYRPPFEHTYRVQMCLIDNNIATDAWANVDIEWKNE